MMNPWAMINSEQFTYWTQNSLSQGIEKTYVTPGITRILLLVSLLMNAFWEEI